jgi:alkanesulfonate monooxygenase SsuD/methylene tetrahydromethanopterin reductase-like flavin-dependent oxidoreductase (luciferase family)
VQAKRIAASAELHYVRRAQGEYLPLESPEAAAAYPYTPSDRERLARHRARLAVADRVKDRLLALADATRADEIIVTTLGFDHAARRHSYELLAKAFALPQ